MVGHQKSNIGILRNMLNDSEIVALVRQEVDDSLGYDADVLASKREAALRYYHGAMAAPAEGRSSIVSKDVADSVHALLAMMSPIFQTSMITFSPESEEDEQPAQMESDYVRYVLDKSDGWSLLNEAAHDALLIGNGWLKSTVDEQVDVVTEQYGELSDNQLLKVNMPTAENQTVEATETKDGWSVKRSTTTYKLNVECISPDVMLFSGTSGQFDVDELRFIGERKLMTVSDLKALGLSEDDITSMPDSEDDYWPAIRAREGLYQNETADNFAKQQAERLKEVFDCYMRVDLSEDGTSELRHISIGGTVLIENEPARCIPYSTGSPVPMPHRVQGTGMFELMAQIQDAKTTTLRNYLDNLDVANGSRLGVLDGEVNMKDVTNGRINGVVRMKRPDAILPLPVTDIGPQSIQGLTYLDTVRSQRGGASLDMNNADRQVMASSATAAMGVQDTAERMAGWYAGNLVNTLLKSTYQTIHKKLRYEMRGNVNAKMGGKWQEVNPSTWKERNHIEVVAGLTSSQRNQKITALSTIIQKLEQVIMQGGEGIITNKAKLFGAYSDYIRAVEIGSPDEYLLNPDEPEQQQAAQRQGEASQKQAEQLDRLAQQDRQLENQKMQLDKYKHDSDLKFDYDKLASDNEVAEAKMTTDAIVKLKSVGSSNEG